MSDQPNLVNLGCALFVAVPIFACGYLAGVHDYWPWAIAAGVWFVIGPMVLDLLGFDPPAEGDA